MADDRDAMERHRKVIANLGVSGLSNTVELEFKRASDRHEVREFRGVCSECKQPFRPGYAVRCSDPECDGEVFHPSCFGAHTMRSHQPSSVTVIMREKGEDVFEYVDEMISAQTHSPVMERVPLSTDGAGEGEDVEGTVSGPIKPGEEMVYPNAGDPNISVPDTPAAVGTMTDEEKEIRQKKARKSSARSKKRSSK